MIPTQEQVVAKLAALGDTPDAAASSLKEMGVRGAPCEPELCVLAVYLWPEEDRLGGDPLSWLVVGARHIHVSPNGADVFTVPFPAWARNFVLAFDRGDYPEIVKPGLYED